MFLQQPQGRCLLQRNRLLQQVSNLLQGLLPRRLLHRGQMLSEVSDLLQMSERSNAER